MLGRASGKAIAKQARTFASVQAVSSVTPPPESANVPLQLSLFQKLLGRSAMPRTPIDRPFPGVPSILEPKAMSPDPQISTLKSGMRVCSLETNSPVAQIGVFINSGSRDEPRELSGISHFLEYMALKSTPSRSDFKLFRDLSQLGASVNCQASREHMYLSAETLRHHVPETLAILAEVVQNPLFLEVDIRDARELYAKQAEELKKQNPDIELLEAAHEAAYQNNTLGLPFRAPLGNLENFDSATLREWVAQHYTADRVVISAVGVDHKDLVDLVDKLFTGMPRAGTPHHRPRAQYTGGEIRMHQRESKDGMTNVFLGFETVNWHDKDVVPVSVLQAMMGGGGSFSAGGPGKGMYSRLYTNVLNVHGWVENAMAEQFIYDDSGLFGFLAKALPQNAGMLVEVMLEEAHKMSGPVSDIELKRAKNALKSRVYMNLESRPLVADDMGRQLLTYDKILSPQTLASMIDAVTPQDVTRVAQAMLKTTPTVAASGDLSYLPRYDAIVNAVKFLKQ